MTAARAVDAGAIAQRAGPGVEAIRQAIHQARIDAVRTALDDSR
jgi:hypothetical protein